MDKVIIAGIICLGFGFSAMFLDLKTKVKEPIVYHFLGFFCALCSLLIGGING